LLIDIEEVHETRGETCHPSKMASFFPTTKSTTPNRKRMVERVRQAK